MVQKLFRNSFVRPGGRRYRKSDETSSEWSGRYTVECLYGHFISEIERSKSELIAN
jgi:hypothetical protein